MWALKNRTPYAAERTWIRDKLGVHYWVISVKASFDLAPEGALKLADEQAPPLLTAEYVGEPGKSSVRYEADLGPMKPTTDVTVLAHAYAPEGKATRTVPVSLRVAELQKILLVHGIRVFGGGNIPNEALPFTKQAICYEQAYGGMDLSAPDPSQHAYDSRNPVGVGFAKQPNRLLYQRAPSIEYPHGALNKAGPAGFGPIASYWSPRLEYAGTYDARWEQTKKPLLPDDWDVRSSLCSPADQRPAQYLHGGELIELVHMTPEGVLRFQLPKVYLTFSTSIGRRREEHRSRLTGVIVEPEAPRVMMVWQTVLRVRSAELDYLDETVIREKPYLT